MSQEVKITSADGGALGLFGLALVTLIGSAGFLGQPVAPVATAWILGVAVIAHLTAAFIGFRGNNIFGGTVFGAYGLFWLTLGLRDLLAGGFFGDTLATGIAGGATAELGFAFLGYLIFSVLMTIAATKTNGMLVIILALIALLFLGLTFSTFGIAVDFFTFIANISRLLLSLVSFYAVFAIVMNTMCDREVVPVGSKKSA